MVRALDRLHGDDDQGVSLQRRRPGLRSADRGGHPEGYPGAPHGITDTHKEQLGNDLLDFLNSSGDVTELVGASTGKEDA